MDLPHFRKPAYHGQGALLILRDGMRARFKAWKARKAWPKLLLGSSFDSVSRLSKVGFGGFLEGFSGILNRRTKSKQLPSAAEMPLRPLGPSAHLTVLSFTP